MPMLRRPDREKLAAQRNFEVLIAALMIFDFSPSAGRPGSHGLRYPKTGEKTLREP